MNKRQWLGSGLALAAGAAGWQVGLLQQNRQEGTNHRRLPFPESLPRLDASAFNFKALEGKNRLINFWATWCAPCVEEMPLLDRFYADHAGNGLQMLGIAADKPESVQKFLKNTPVKFDIVLAGFEGVALSKALGNQSGGLPFSILIDKKDGILFTKQGQLTTNDLQIITRHLG